MPVCGGAWGLYRWLRDSIAANKPYDKFVRELITAEGSCAENAPANFWRTLPDANEAGEATVQVFFGVRLLCARCHDHPFEKWVQTDYYGLTAFFSQVNKKAGSRREDLVIFRDDRGRYGLVGRSCPHRRTDLAYGRQMMTEIAVALALKPEVLLLDEPAAGVPSGDVGIIVDLIEQLPPGVALLIIDHDMDLVFRVARRITVLASGRVLAEGPPGEIAENPAVREVYLGERRKQ